MSRKLTAATLALTVAGGVYLMAGPAHASNMGFKLERNFPVVRYTPTDPNTSFFNAYMLSWPLFNGLGDIADSSFVGNSKCVGDAVGGPATGDGTVDVIDAICDLFTDRTTAGNSFGISRFNRDTCRFETVSASFGSFPAPGRLSFGTPPTGPFLLDRDAGSWITVAASTTIPANLPTNRAVVVGSHDPSYTGRQIKAPTPDCVPRQDIISLPYHTMYQNADEILCGLAGVDWVDTTPADGNPDTCTRGIFDGAHAIAVLTFDNVHDSSTITIDNAFTTRNVTWANFPAPPHANFSGTNYPLMPGEAYFLSIAALHTTTTFLSPHF